jgi:hypothetical protein
MKNKVTLNPIYYSKLSTVMSKIYSDFSSSDIKVVHRWLGTQGIF